MSAESNCSVFSILLSVCFHLNCAHNFLFWKAPFGPANKLFVPITYGDKLPEVAAISEGLLNISKCVNKCNNVWDETKVPITVKRYNSRGTQVMRCSGGRSILSVVCSYPGASKPLQPAAPTSEFAPSRACRPHVVKLSPQPQLPLELGFWKTNSDLHSSRHMPAM